MPIEMKDNGNEIVIDARLLLKENLERTMSKRIIVCAFFYCFKIDGRNGV